MSRFEEIMGALDKETKDLLRLGNEIVINKLPSPSFGLNIGLEGGVVRGSQVMLWGPKSAGKTTYCLQQIAVAQKLDLACAFIDVEGTYDPSWGARLGINNDELMVFTPKSMVKFTNRMISLIEAGVDLIIVDSVTALMPAAYVEKDGEIKSFEDTNAMGSLARDLSKAMSMINGANEARGTTLLLISQSRMGPKGGMHWGMKPTGGEALRFYSSTVLKLNSSNSQQNTILGDVHAGNAVFEKSIGRRVKWEIELNKTSAQGYIGEYSLMFEGENVGIDNLTEVFDYAVKAGIITRAGAWYKYDGENIGQGAPKALEALKNTPEILETIKERITDGGSNSLEQVSAEDD